MQDSIVPMTDVYEAISQVSELEERVHEELTVYLYLCPKLQYNLMQLQGLTLMLVQGK